MRANNCHPERGLFFARTAQRITAVEGSLFTQHLPLLLKEFSISRSCRGDAANDHAYVQLHFPISPPLAIASKYHDACGSHCSPQRQSLSAPVSRYGRRKSISFSSLNPLVMPFEIPPGAFVNAHESKYMYAGLLRPTPFSMHESNGFNPRIQFS